jgi:hypothetical protein
LILTKIIRKLQGQYFGVKKSLYGLLKLPGQTKKERLIFKALFDLMTKNRKFRVFEWGSGYSTLYYAAYLSRKGIDFEWHSMDNNRLWHEKIKKLVEKDNLSSNVKLYLMEFPPFWEKPGWGSLPPACGVYGPNSDNEKGYIDFPKGLDCKFDVVVVDARFRRHCLRTAKDVVSLNGVVIIHDAQKKHYHDGIDEFPYQGFIDTGEWYPLQDPLCSIWVGSLSDNNMLMSMMRSL